MKYRLIKLLVFIVFGSMCAIVNADIRFKTISIEQGLPQVSVNAIINDKAGFMWFGTQDGLARFDGSQFKVFKHHPKDEDSLSDNFVQSIAQSDDGRIWIGTLTGGLNIFEPKYERFTHYPNVSSEKNTIASNNVTSILVTEDQKVWIGTNDGGVNIFSSQRNVFISVYELAKQPITKKIDSVSSLAEGPEGNIWIGSKNGEVLKYNPTSNLLEKFFLEPNKSNGSSVKSIIEYSRNELWIATEGSGIFSFNTETKKIENLQSNGKKLSSIKERYISTLSHSNNGDIWIGTRNDGLRVFEKRTHNILELKNIFLDNNSLSDNSILSIARDKAGAMWIGTYKGGVSYHSDKFKEFIHFQYSPYSYNSLNSNDIRSIFVDQEDTLWVGTSTGLDSAVIRNEQPDKNLQFKRALPGLSDNIVRALAQDREGRLWIGTQGNGVNVYDKKTSEIKHYTESSKDYPLSDNYILTIKEDSLGNIWIGTQNGGVNRINTEASGFRVFFHDNSDENSLSNNSIRVIEEDSAGTIWVGSNKGLNKYDEKNDRFIKYRVGLDTGSNSVRDIKEGDDKRFWVATRNGLYLFDRDTLSFRHYTTDDGLPNNVIYQIQIDDSGYLWLSTNKGLSRFDPNAETFVNYDKHDGIGNIEYTAGASFKSKSGFMYFGGTEGITLFRPDKIIEDSTSPETLVTELNIMNEPVDIAKNNVREKNSFKLDKAIYLKDSIVLEYSDNVVSFEFSAINYLNPKKNRFRYRLLGFDNDWVLDRASNRLATYTNLEPGEYTFQVEASNSLGTFLGEPKSLQVKVSPPFWKTRWAYISYIVLFSAFILLIFVRQKRKVEFHEKLNRELELKVKERTAELEKTNNKMKKLSTTDQLTGLKNRRFLTENIQADLQNSIALYSDPTFSSRIDKDIVAFLIDIDHFKQINDTYGHNTGDRVLIQFKDILVSSFRKSDYIIRWGGEEFLVVIRFSDRTIAPTIAEELRKRVEDFRFEIGEQSTVRISCSIGFSAFPFYQNQPNAINWEQTVDLADHCLYAAKRTSRNAWVSITSNDENANHASSKVKSETKELIKNKDLALFTSIEDVEEIVWGYSL